MLNSAYHKTDCHTLIARSESAGIPSM